MGRICCTSTANRTQKFEQSNISLLIHAAPVHRSCYPSSRNRLTTVDWLIPRISAISRVVLCGSQHSIRANILLPLAPGDRKLKLDELLLQSNSSRNKSLTEKCVLKI